MSGPSTEDYVPGWQRAGDDRWRKVDEIGVMHLMLKATRPETSQAPAETLYLELHGLTLHIYRGPAEVSDDVWPIGDPTKYDPAVHRYSHLGTHDVSTSALSLLRDESDVWTWLEQYANGYGAS